MAGVVPVRPYDWTPEPGEPKPGGIPPAPRCPKCGGSNVEHAKRASWAERSHCSWGGSESLCRCSDCPCLWNSEETQ